MAEVFHQRSLCLHRSQNLLVPLVETSSQNWGCGCCWEPNDPASTPIHTACLWRLAPNIVLCNVFWLALSTSSLKDSSRSLNRTLSFSFLSLNFFSSPKCRKVTMSFQHHGSEYPFPLLLSCMLQIHFQHLWPVEVVFFRFAFIFRRSAGSVKPVCEVFPHKCNSRCKPSSLAEELKLIEPLTRHYASPQQPMSLCLSFSSVA